MTHYTKTIMQNKTIIQYTIQYQYKMNVKIEVLQKINRVRLYKRLLLPFKLVRIDRDCATNCYKNETEISSVHWKIFERDDKIDKQIQADFNIWNKYIKWLRY